MALMGTFAIALFFGFKIYPDLEYTGGTSVSSCTGMCYAEYVETYGTPAEIERKKQELASADEFSSIRGLWKELYAVMVRMVKEWQCSQHLKVRQKSILQIDSMHTKTEKQ